MLASLHSSKTEHHRPSFNRSMSILLLSLDSIERQIAFGLSQDATVIYYQHFLNAFDFLIEEDHAKANQEWIKFKHELGTGKNHLCYSRGRP